MTELTAKEHELESQARVSEVSVEAAARELDQIAERTRAQAAEVEALKAQAEALAHEREALLRQRDDLQSLVTTDETRLVDAEAALRDAGREQGSLQSEADRARAAAAAALSEATSHKSQLAQIERQRLDLQRAASRRTAARPTTSPSAPRSSTARARATSRSSGRRGS